jgi:hypothetical protein
MFDDDFALKVRCSNPGGKYICLTVFEDILEKCPFWLSCLKEYNMKSDMAVNIWFKHEVFTATGVRI